MPRRYLVEDGQIPGLLVDPDWWEPYHPQEEAHDNSDSEQIYRPAIDGDINDGVITALSASWSPAAVDEDLNPGQVSATEYTLTGSGGSTPYTYTLLPQPGSLVILQQTGPNTVRLYLPPWAEIGEVYEVQVTGIIDDALGQRTAAVFMVQITALSSEFEELLALYEPDHWWKLQDDSETTFADSGFASAIALSSTSTVIAPRVPSMFIGASGAKGYGLGFSEQNSGASSPITGSAISQNATGTFLGFVRAATQAASNDALPALFSQTFNIGNISLRFEIAIVDVGGYRVEVLVQSNANSMIARTDAGSIVRGNWYFIVVTQAADGTGPKIYINGSPVNVTITLAGTGTNDWWLSTLAGLHGAPDNLRVCGSWLTTQMRGTYAHMTCWDSGDVLSAADISLLWSAAQAQMYGFATPRVNSFHDQVRAIIPSPPIWMGLNTPVTSGNQPVTQFGITGDVFRHNGFEAGDFDGAAGCLVNTAVDLSDDSVLWFDSGSNTDTVSDVPTGQADDFTGTQGTLLVFVYPTDVSSTRCFFANGVSSTTYIRVELVSGQLRFSWATSSGSNAYTVTINALTLSVDTWYMVTIVHDGVAPRFFVDGVEYTGGDLTISSSGTGSASTCWFSGLGISNNQFRLGGINGSASTRPFRGRLKHLIYKQQVLTPAEISTLYTAARVAA